MGTTKCGSASIGTELKFGASFEVWVLDEGFGFNDEFVMFDGLVDYPHAQFSIGNCR